MKTLLYVILSVCSLSIGWAQTAAASSQTSAPVPALEISHAGTRTVIDGSPKNFTGAVRQERVFAALAPSRAAGGSVT